MEALVASEAAQVIIPILTGILASQPGGEGVATGLRTAGMMGDMSAAFGAGNAAGGFADAEKARLTEELNRRQGMEGIQKTAMSPQEMAAGTGLPGEGGLVGPGAPVASDLYGLPTERSAARATNFLDAMPGMVRAAPHTAGYMMDQATRLGAPAPTPKPTPDSLYGGTADERIAGVRKMLGEDETARVNFAEGSVNLQSTPKGNEPTAQEQLDKYNAFRGGQGGTFLMDDGSTIRYKDPAAAKGEQPGNFSLYGMPPEESITYVNRDPVTGRMATQSQRR